MIDKKEKEKLIALIEAASALIEEGYELFSRDFYKDLKALSPKGEQFGVTTLEFSLCKKYPIESDEREISDLIRSKVRFSQEASA